MNKFNFLALVFAAFAMVACEKENDLTNGGGDGGNGEKSWLSLSLKTTAEARALNNPDRENGTAAESKITTATAIFFDSSKKIVETVNLQNTEIGEPSQDNSTATAGAAFKVDNTVKYVLIVANPSVDFSNRMSGLTTANNFDDVNAALGSTVAAVATPNAFMMTNAQGDLAPYLKTSGSWQLEELTLYESAGDAEKAPLDIYLDRVVAKVRVKNGHDNTDVANGAVVGTFGWVLNVTNKQFFPASKRTKTQREINGASSIWSDRYEQGSYRIDPNYNNLAPEDITWEYGVSGTKYADHYTAYSSTSAPGSWLSSGSQEYCLENTQIKDFNKHAYTTQVLLRAQFAPKNFQDVDGNNVPNADPTISYFKIGAGLYTFNTLYSFLEREISNKYTDQDPDAYQTPLTDGFNLYMTHIGGTGLTLPTKVDFDNDYPGLTGVDDLLIVIKTQYDAAELKIKDAGSDTFGNFSFYDGGVNYYKIMIKHDNDDSPTFINELGEFGVVRNSVYDILVNSINSPGYPNIPDPDPDTEDEDDQKYLSIKITINPWTWYTQTENL